MLTDEARSQLIPVYNRLCQTRLQTYLKLDYDHRNKLECLLSEVFITFYHFERQAGFVQSIKQVSSSSLDSALNGSLLRTPQLTCKSAKKKFYILGRWSQPLAAKQYKWSGRRYVF
jgi:hypothetical protein